MYLRTIHVNSWDLKHDKMILFLNKDGSKNLLIDTDIVSSVLM